MSEQGELSAEIAWLLGAPDPYYPWWVYVLAVIVFVLTWGWLWGWWS